VPPDPFIYPCPYHNCVKTAITGQRHNVTNPRKCRRDTLKVRIHEGHKAIMPHVLQHPARSQCAAEPWNRWHLMPHLARMEPHKMNARCGPCPIERLALKAGLRIPDSKGAAV
jgi:hypothetical protein